MHFNKNLLILIGIVCLISFVQTALSQCSCVGSIKPKDPQVTVTSSDGVFIRKQACTDSEILGSLKQNEKFIPKSDCLGQCINDQTSVWLGVENPEGFIWSGATD